MREDSKGLNLIDYAWKNKMPDIVDMLIEAGVPCSFDVKRKLGKQKSVSKT